MQEMSGNSAKNQVTDNNSTAAHGGTSRGSDVGTEQSPIKKELSLFQFNSSDSSQGAAGNLVSSPVSLQHAVGPQRLFTFDTPAGSGLTSVPPTTTGSSQGPDHLILPPAGGTEPPRQGSTVKSTTGLQHDARSPRFAFGTPAGNVLTSVPPTTTGSSQAPAHLILPPVIGTQPPLFLGRGSGKWTPSHAMTQTGFTSSSPGNVAARQPTPRPQGFTITPGSVAGCSRASAQAGSGAHTDGTFHDRKGFTRSIYRITVKNLSPGVGMKELKHFFQERVGNVLYADAHTPIRLQGLVEFKYYNSMMEALVYNGCSLGNQAIELAQDSTSLGNPSVLVPRVNLFGQDSIFDSTTDEKQHVWTNPDGKRPSFGRTSMILVGAIPRTATIGQLATHFKGVQLCNIRLIMKDESVNRGYGYLSFIDDGETAPKALAMYKFKSDSRKNCSLSLDLISPKCVLLVSPIPVTVSDPDLLCRFKHLPGCERVVGNLPETKGKGHSNDGSCLILFRTSEGATNGSKSISETQKIVSWADPIEAKGDYEPSNSSSLASAAKKMGLADE